VPSRAKLHFGSTRAPAPNTYHVAKVLTEHQTTNTYHLTIHVTVLDICHVMFLGTHDSSGDLHKYPTGQKRLVVVIKIGGRA
jgi:hypothetical protein